MVTTIVLLAVTRVVRICLPVFVLVRIADLLLLGWGLFWSGLNFDCRLVEVLSKNWMIQFPVPQRCDQKDKVFFLNDVHVGNHLVFRLLGALFFLDRKRLRLLLVRPNFESYGFEDVVAELSILLLANLVVQQLRALNRLSEHGGSLLLSRDELRQQADATDDLRTARLQEAIVLGARARDPQHFTQHLQDGNN